MMRMLGSILAGAALAAIVACGGSSAKRSTSMPTAPSAVQGDAGPGIPAGKHDQRIVDLDAKIEADMQKLGVTRPASPVTTCAQPPCDAMTLSVKPSADPKCTHSASQTCTDSCQLADSICENADTICKIAKELGSDAWATGKCADAETSCDTARGKCCGCV